jgi:hypothetical protein
VCGFISISFSASGFCRNITLQSVVIVVAAAAAAGGGSGGCVQML